MALKNSQTFIQCLSILEEMTLNRQSIGFSKEDCITHLQAYSDEIEQIFALFDDRSFIRKGQKEKAQELLTNLKEKFKNDYKSRDTKRGEAQMTQVESAFFFPAIHEAYTSIYVKTNSRPSPKWVFELYDAQSTIKYYLHQLQDKK